MKILAIIGSPRKGNTYQTVQKIEQFHKKSVDCQYDYLFLKDSNLGLCKGCFVCISKGEELCPLKDDINRIIEKIESADGVILASPNYVANVTWLMKNFIDRMAFTMHRPKYFKQKFMLVITSGSYMGVKNAMKALAVVVSGGKTVSRLSVFNSPGMNEDKKKKQENKISKAADRFVRQLNIKNDAKPPISYLIWFSVFKASSVLNKEALPADFLYYKNKEYFTDSHLDTLQKITVKVFTHFFSFMIRKGFV